MCGGVCGGVCDGVAMAVYVFYLRLGSKVRAIALHPRMDFMAIATLV